MQTEHDLRKEFKNVCKELSLYEKKHNRDLPNAIRNVNKVIIKIVQMDSQGPQRQIEEKGFELHEN